MFTPLPDNLEYKFLGHVKWFNQDRGVGVIEEDREGNDVILLSKNINTVDQSLEAGDIVRFHIVLEDGCQTAKQVVLVF